jgi:GNAT superfamily N-acetyltransferase
VSVTLATGVQPALEELWRGAWKEVGSKRGGEALLETIGDGLASEDVLRAAVAASALWIFDDGALKGLALCRAQLIEGVYVVHHARRQGVGTKLVRALLDGPTPPLDAFALPGDRATKSLFESIGWKARLLTMRGA